MLKKVYFNAALLILIAKTWAEDIDEFLKLKNQEPVDLDLLTVVMLFLTRTIFYVCITYFLCGTLGYAFKEWGKTFKKDKG